MKISTFSDWLILICVILAIFSAGLKGGVYVAKKQQQGYIFDLPEEFNQRDSTDSFIIVRQTKDTIVLGFKN